MIAIRLGLGLLAMTAAARIADPAVAQERTPLQTVEVLHAALREANPAKAESVLHEQYSGVSLQGPTAGRHVYVETRAAAIATTARIHPGAWDVHILSASERIDPNGLAQVWARYVFYLDGAPNHCGYESYVLFRGPDGWKVVSFADTDNALNGREPADVCPAA